MDSQRCRGCRQERQIEQYDLNRAGIRKRTCRQCLERNRIRRQERRLEVRHGQAQQRNSNSGVQSSQAVNSVMVHFPLASVENMANWNALNLERMDILCPSCAARHWVDERSHPSTIAAPRFESCCKKGDVVLDKLPNPPEVLQALISENMAEAKHYRQHIRRYNCALSFTSIWYMPDERMASLGPGVQCFHIHGELYHLQGPLQPQEGQQPQFAQLFLYDPQFAANIRHEQRPELMRSVLEQLTFMLEEINPFISLYKTARERLLEQEGQDQDVRILLNPQLRLVLEAGVDRRRHNLPTVEEVAMVLPTEYGESTFRDIVLAKRSAAGEDNGFSNINSNHAAYMPLHYVLLFPRGELGWNWGLELQNPDGIRQKTRMSQRAYYRYRLHVRENETTLLFQSERLFQQYLVDAWATCDQNKLSWLHSHQNNLRADVYNGLVDIVRGRDLDPDAVGRSVILPSSYTGGDRFMQQLFQDSMAIVRHFGRPTLFITFTANPKWEEITRELLPGQTSIDRPDLVARVFHLKQQQLLKDLKKKQVFGEFLGCVWTIEYQKRGLPHMHLLLFLKTDPSFLTAENIDRIISAELPPPTSQRNIELAEIIKTITVHGPCGTEFPHSPCMKQSGNRPATCSKSFPKPFCEETIIQENGYPQYRRRNNGQSFQVPRRNGIPGATFTVDNRWIVPFNPYLSWKYKAHINVEVCASIKSIKYIHKYVYKGSDQTTLQVEDSNHDEIRKYLQGRYIGPTEAVWRLFEFGTHEEWPPVIHLALHLPGEQPVYFEPDAGPLALQERLANSSSTLIAYFKYNEANPDGPKYLYQDFPAHFVYQPRTKEWKVRERGIAIGRMYTCHGSPFGGDRYYLRLLLTIVPGATSFIHLRTVDGVVYQTFREACKALDLLQDDQDWIRYFAEAVTFATGHHLRILFSTALIYQEIADPGELWDQFKENLCDDLPHRLQLQGLDGLIIPEGMENLHLDYGLHLISEHLAAGRKTLEDCDMPLPIVEWKLPVENTLIAEELSRDLWEQPEHLDAMVSSLNPEQRACYDEILQSMSGPTAAQYFLQGAAGTGKTFLYRCLCGTIRMQGKVVLCVASSGIAAQLLPGGITSHSRFRIPLNIHEDSVCSVTRNSELAGLLQMTALIIWDEVPMQNKYCFMAVDRLLNDICQSQEGHRFGNIPIVFGGDFAQILPVIPNGNRGAIVNACIQRSHLWPGFHQLRLSQNMRVAPGSSNVEFAGFLAQMSYSPEMCGNISLPTYIRRLSSLDAFCDQIFPPVLMQGAHLDYESFKSRAILSFRNDTVTEFNNILLQKIDGEMQFFHAMNSIEEDEAVPGVEPLPVEFLQSIELASLPPSKLCLKIGAPVILLRNLSPKQGLCNGTRMTITRLGRSCIGGIISGGQFDGEFRLLPRIRLTTLEGDLPFILTRRQFPIRLCFAMTVNKSQGQSLTTVGVDLRTPAFTHGQLYVALSRVTSLDGLTVLFSENNDHGRTENVVYPEVLL